MPVPTTTLPPTTTTTMPASGGGYGYFPAAAVWSQDISKAALDSQSATIISWLSDAGGWGNGNKMQVDFSFTILRMDATTPMLTFVKNSGYYSPDCDKITTFPVPIGGAIEGFDDYTCSGGEDCHLLVVDSINHKLYESYQSSVSSNQLHSTCGVIWDMTKVYPASGRGEHCTSTDAAGFPVAPLLFTADELKAGAINHAIRFILPNARITKGLYVHPATHTGGPTGPATAVPYGAHFRLKANYDVSKLKPAAQVVARAMQKYGMFLSDGGNIALTAADDRFTTAKYKDVGFNPQDLSDLNVTDFEMVDGGARISDNNNTDCVRNP
jgi:serine/threonine-protein kinase